MGEERGGRRTRFFWAVAFFFSFLLLLFLGRCIILEHILLAYDPRILLVFALIRYDTILTTITAYLPFTITAFHLPLPLSTYQLSCMHLPYTIRLYAFNVRRGSTWMNTWVFNQGCGHLRWKGQSTLCDASGFTSLDTTLQC